MAENKRTKTRVKLYECEICKKRYSQRYDLIVHNRLHTGEKPFECEVCKKTFCSSSNLSSHKRVHSVEKPFSCEICKKRLTKKMAWFNINGFILEKSHMNVKYVKRQLVQKVN